MRRGSPCGGGLDCSGSRPRPADLRHAGEFDSRSGISSVSSASEMGEGQIGIGFAAQLEAEHVHWLLVHDLGHRARPRRIVRGSIQRH